MATTTETIRFGQYPLQVRPEPLRLRSGNKRHAIVAAPPSPVTSRATSFQSSHQDVEKLEQHLPPVDGGKEAWKFLFAACMVEALVFGFPLNYGIFQNYYFTHPPFEGNANLPTVGTLGTAFYFLGAPIATYLVRRYHRWQKEVIWTGCGVAIIGLVGASFASDFGTLVATQGVVFGIGILIMYYPVFNMLNEWFVDRRGLALGMLCAATGASGLFYPFVLEILLNRCGPATTLRVSAIALTILCGPVLPLLKDRLFILPDAAILHLLPRGRAARPRVLLPDALSSFLRHVVGSKRPYSGIAARGGQRGADAGTNRIRLFLRFKDKAPVEGQKSAR
ncbi:MAG: hypothetical protein Q9168_006687 [Polycauliona sp. 1 TL-2023]